MEALTIILGIGLQVLLATAEPSSNGGKVIMCYYGSWAVYRNDLGKFDVEDIDPLLCTHLVFAFAGIHPVSHHITVLDPWNELEDNWGRGAYDRFTKLKNRNPNLKTLLAVGGWNEGSSKFSDMVSTYENRKSFIGSAVKLVTEHNFDGLDIDWEYPGGRVDSPGNPLDKKNFIFLLKELRAELDKQKLMLTAAVSAGKNIIDYAYDVPAMSELLDYISVMTYDFHGWWDGHYFTGHNAPLYGSPSEDIPESPGYHLNANYSMNYWHQLGARKDQLLMGLPTYGRGFVLSNQDINGFYAPAIGPVNGGIYTNQPGYWGHNEFCEKLLSDNEWSIYRDSYTVAPYAVKGPLWHSFDDEESIRKKSEYINENRFGGGMVWSLETDDFRGICSGTKSSLINTIAQVLNGGLQTVPPGWVPVTPPVTVDTTDHTYIYTEDPETGGVCTEGSGNNVDTDDCSMFFICAPNDEGGYHVQHLMCPEGLLFNSVTLTCDWPENVSCLGTKQMQSNGVAKEAMFQCPGIGLYPAGNCSKYFYSCAFMISALMTCPADLVFDELLKVCNYPYQVASCQGVVNPKSTAKSAMHSAPPHTSNSMTHSSAARFSYL